MYKDVTKVISLRAKTIKLKIFDVQVNFWIYCIFVKTLFGWYGGWGVYRRSSLFLIINFIPPDLILKYAPVSGH